MKTFTKIVSYVTIVEKGIKKNFPDVKKAFCGAIILISSTTLFGQAPNWQWAESASGTGSNFCSTVSVDANGNSYVIGTFMDSTILFGSTLLTSSGSSDIFVVKYNTSGNIVWAKSAGGTNFDKGQSISVDGSGNVYIVGIYYSPTISFGTHTLTNANGADIFIVKYDSSGNVVWAKSAGGTDYDEVNSISTDGNGNVYLTGTFGDHSLVTISFGSVSLTNTGGWLDIYLAKYDTAGNIVWAKSAGGVGADHGYTVTADLNGNTYLTGAFGGYASASPISFGNTVLTNVGGYDVFVTKYDGSGSVIWATSAGGIYDDAGNSITIDANGNSYITGSFDSPNIVFGSTTLTNAGTTGTSDYNSDILIAKYDSSGNVLWAKTNGGTFYDYGKSITVDASGNSYVIGQFSSPTISFGSSTFINAGADDIFVAKYDALGNSLWAKSIGGTSYDYGNSITVDASGTYIAGKFGSPTVSLGSIILTNANHAATPEDTDVFIAKLDNDSTALGITGNENGNKKLKVFPNPAKDKLIVSIPKNGKSTILIIDMLGKAVKQLITDEYQTELDVSDLKDGIYFVKHNHDNTSYVEKVIISK